MTEVSPMKRMRYGLDRRPGPQGGEISADSASVSSGGVSGGGGDGGGEGGGGGGGGAQTVGGALGPDWHANLGMSGKAFDKVKFACVTFYRGIAFFVLFN